MSRVLCQLSYTAANSTAYPAGTGRVRPKASGLRFAIREGGRTVGAGYVVKITK